MKKILKKKKYQINSKVMAYAAEGVTNYQCKCSNNIRCIANVICW